MDTDEEAPLPKLSEWEAGIEPEDLSAWSSALRALGPYNQL